jgi:hypothetical protein
VPVNTNKRRQPQPREWELSKDRFAEQDHDTLEWCEKYGIDVLALANGTQKRPPLPSFADIQRYDVPSQPSPPPPHPFTAAY